MTLNEARLILTTYKLPLTIEQLKIYNEALEVLKGRAFTAPPVNKGEDND